MLSDELRYKILKILKDDPHTNQRDLAARLDISLGRVNYCIQALIKKGHIKVNNFRHNKNKQASYAYLLTPRGIEEKAKVTLRFLRNKLTEYENLEKEIEELRREVNSGEIAADSLPLGNENP